MWPAIFLTINLKYTVGNTAVVTYIMYTIGHSYFPESLDNQLKKHSSVYSGGGCGWVSPYAKEVINAIYNSQRNFICAVYTLYSVFQVACHEGRLNKLKPHLNANYYKVYMH